MKIRSLQLEQFRSFQRAHCTFGDGITVLLGPNGVGKTNTLEALCLLSAGQSFLSVDLEHLVHWGTTHFRITANCLQDDGDNMTAEVAAQTEPRKQKAYFINDVRKPMAKFCGTIPLVLFTPEDLRLFTGSPSRRRTFLDQILLQLDPEYAQHKQQYDKVVKQRNTLLKAIREGSAAENGLDVWDAQLAEHGSIVQERRIAILDAFAAVLPEQAAALSEGGHTYAINYIRKRSEDASLSLRDALHQLLVHYRQRDIILQSTTIGPHRDDWSLTVDGHNIAQYGSRGQQRTYVLCLVMEHVRMLERVRREKPIVLLDDVFSELDDAHQRALLASLTDHQVCISTTHMPDGITAPHILTISDGQFVTSDSGTVEREREGVGSVVGAGE